MKVLVAGASGFLGSHLCRALKLSGNEVVALVRKDGSLENTDRAAQWDGQTVGDWVGELETSDALVNLSGSSVAVKWTPENRQEIYESRVGTTRLLAEACQLVSVPPRVWLNSSGINIYRQNLEEPLGEDGPQGQGFLADLCRDWEAAMFEAELSECRRIALRTPPVLGRGGGSFEVFLKLTKWFLGGQIVSGRQWMSWIHIQDWVRMAVWAIGGPREPKGSEVTEVQGPLNLCSPNPVRNAEFMAELRRAVGRPWSPPAPALAIKLIGALGGPDPRLALEGFRIVPERALTLSFEFGHPELDGALQDLLRN